MYAFSAKIGLKSAKNVIFCILCQWGELSSPLLSYCQLGSICRSNSCKQWKREVTKRILAEFKRRPGTALIACIYPNTNLLSAVEWPNGASQLRPSMPYSCKNFPKFIPRSRGTWSYAFARSTKHAKRSFPYSQDFSKICFRVKVWSVILRPGQKPHWQSCSFDFTISRHFLSRHLACTLPSKLRVISLCSTFIACGLLF